MLGDRGAAEDVVQDAFLGLYRHWDRLADPGNALTYVRSAVLNRCRNALRQRGQARAAMTRQAAPRADRDASRAEAAALIGEEHRQVLAAHPGAARPAARGPRAPVLPRPVRGRGRPRHGRQPGHRQVGHLPRGRRARPEAQGGLMITTEDRARAAMQAIGDTVRDAPPLELPPGARSPDLPARRRRGAARRSRRAPPQPGPPRRCARPGGAARPGSRGRDRRWRSKLAPVAAAVAVAAVAVALVTIKDVPNGRVASPSPSTTSARPGRPRT